MFRVRKPVWFRVNPVRKGRALTLPSIKELMLSNGVKGLS